MSNLTPMNRGWHFEADGKSQLVDLPHSATELPVDYLDETSYQKPFRYSREIEITDAMAGKEIVLRFDGAMADTRVFLNGVEVAAHTDGYTPFDARLTDHVKPGTNLVEVTLSGVENPDIPPFGGRIDYLCYAGIYRDVWLRVSDPVCIGAVKIETPGLAEGAAHVTARVELDNPRAFDVTGALTARLHDPEGREIGRQTVLLEGEECIFDFDTLGEVVLWDIDTPALYRIDLSFDGTGSQDVRSGSFGFRTAEFRADGFFLNGRRLVLVGLNRHQSFPHVGYALGRAAQERDAEILKHELGLNVVRTSHYPQSPWFLDHCDRIGLLVLEEIPGWQHIGGDLWKDRCVENVSAMIRRDWNHPSVILWGVRVNESHDDHDLYTRTNARAHELDPTRQTGGIRCITDSEMLEDVYTMNDFVLGSEIMPGNNRGRLPLRPQREVTGLDREVPYLVTEYAGHMYPTTIEDGEDRQVEHVLKHLEVLDAAHGDPSISGCIGWCYADYNTHKDFGAGDRICHHGVMTMARQPKFAAFAYASQMDQDDRVVMEPVTYWTLGNRSAGGVMPILVLTNCDRVEIRCGDKVMVAEPARDRFPHLPHPPVIFDAAATADNGFDLWGAAWADAEFTGFIDGAPVATKRFSAAPLPSRLGVEIDRDRLAADGVDATRVSVTALDQAGNRLPFLRDVIEISLDGPARLVGGQHRQHLRGGLAGFWLRSAGLVGETRVTLTTERFAPVTFTICEGGAA